MSPSGFSGEHKYFQENMGLSPYDYSSEIMKLLSCKSDHQYFFIISGESPGFYKEAQINFSVYLL